MSDTNNSPGEFYMMPSDEELMIRVKEDDDQRAFQILVQRYRKPILNFVYRFTGNQDMAEDLSQDVFLRLWMSSRTYLPLSKFTTFLYTIAKNLCLNALAKSRNSPYVQSLNEVDLDNSNLNGLADLSSSPEREAIAREIGNKVEEAVSKLSPEHRLVFVLTQYHGLPYQEVAQIVQCPIGTVASRKNTAIKQLREKLSELVY